MNLKIEAQANSAVNANADPELKVSDAAERYTWWQTSIAAVLALIFLFVLWAFVGLAVDNPLYKMYYITSGSMSPSINPGDVICLEPIKEDTVLCVGDIITFKYKNSRTTHRIAEITPDGRIFTKGDANNTTDTYEDNWVLTKNNVIGRYVMSVPLIGYAVSLIKDVFGSGAYLSDSISVDGNALSLAAPLPEATPLDNELSDMAKQPLMPDESGIFTESGFEQSSDLKGSPDPEETPFDIFLPLPSNE